MRTVSRTRKRFLNSIWKRWHKGGVRLERAEAWNDYCLFAFDRWDAVIKEVVKGSYGHARSAQLRSLKTIQGCLLDNDVPGRLNHLIRHKLKY